MQSFGAETKPRRQAPVPVFISQNLFTLRLLSPSWTVLNQLETPVITLICSDPTTPEMEGAGDQQTSSRCNLAVGLEYSIVLKARDLMWDGAKFVIPFPYVITLKETVRMCYYYY